MNATAAKLLVAAGDLMIERNTTDVSLSEIAQKSGVNAALVKYHFGNKDGLLLALLARDAETEVANLEYLLAQPIAPTASRFARSPSPWSKAAMRKKAGAFARTARSSSAGMQSATNGVIIFSASCG